MTRRTPPAPASVIGRKTQSQPDWVDVTITRWNGFFRGVMMEVLSNYTRGGFEALIAGRGIGFFPTVEAAKEACVSAVLERSA